MSYLPQAIQRCTFPQNCMIFELGDGFYAREDTIIQLVSVNGESHITSKCVFTSIVQKENKSLKSPQALPLKYDRKVMTGGLSNYIR